MLRLSVLAFDEIMEGIPLTMYSPVHLARDLSAYDTLAFQLVVASAKGTAPTLTVQVEHSADGRIWMPVATTPEIDQLPLDLARPTDTVGYVPGRAPRLRYTRLRFDLADSSSEVPTVARVRLRIVARDTSKAEWCPCQKGLPSDGTHHQSPPEESDDREPLDLLDDDELEQVGEAAGEADDAHAEEPAGDVEEAAAPPMDDAPATEGNNAQVLGDGLQ